VKREIVAKEWLCGSDYLICLASQAVLADNSSEQLHLYARLMVSAQA
jgi:hypothetical protein